MRPRPCLDLATNLVVLAACTVGAQAGNSDPAATIPTSTVGGPTSTSAGSSNSTAAAAPAAAMANTTTPLVLLSPLSSRLYSTPYTDLEALATEPHLPPSYSQIISRLSSISLVLNTTSDGTLRLPVAGIPLATTSLPTTYPSIYSLSIILLLLSHVFTCALRIPHVLLATLPPRSRHHNLVLGWLRPYAIPSPSTSTGVDAIVRGRREGSGGGAANSIETRLYAFRRIAAYLHAAALLVFGVVTLLWRSRASTAVVALNASTSSLLLRPVNDDKPDERQAIRAELGNLFGLYFALALIGLTAWLAEKKCTERWTIQQQALQQAYDGVRAEYTEWQMDCQRRVWQMERELQQSSATSVVAIGAAMAVGGPGGGAGDEADTSGLKAQVRVDPPAYPANAMCREAELEEGEKGREAEAEGLSWRLVGDQSGKIYN
ncbi:uncharacterized protein PSFLO_06422 [Pseudozyma flocculosa]|nr:uncharacterized protein PSFLO_06422 [Pseudozyma flocculosa]